MFVFILRCALIVTIIGKQDSHQKSLASKEGLIDTLLPQAHHAESRKSSKDCFSEQIISPFGFLQKKESMYFQCGCSLRQA